jgi:hypothetical protein
MLMRLFKLADSAEQETQIILYATLVTPVPSLLKMKTGSGVFNERAVYVIIPILGFTQLS